MARQNMRYYMTEATAPEIAEEIGRLAKEAAEGNSHAVNNLSTLRAMWQDMNTKGIRTAKEWGDMRQAEVETNLNKKGLTMGGSSSAKATPVSPVENAPSAMRAAPLPVLVQGAAKERPPPLVVRGAPKKSEYIPNQSRYSDRVMQYMPAIKEAAAQYGVPEELMVRMITQESGGQTDVTSNKGAHGVAQFMPETARKYGVNTGDPNSSIFGMAHYMRDIYNKLGSWEKTAAGYNTGEHRKYFNKGNWRDYLPRETRGYINNINPEDFDNPEYKPATTLLSKMGVTPTLPPGNPTPNGVIQQQPAWKAPDVVVPPSSGQGPIPQTRPMPAAPKTPANMTADEFEQYKQRYQQMMDIQRKNEMAVPPQGFGDNSNVRAGLIGFGGADGYQDVSQGGMNSMQNLQSLMAMILRGL